MIDSVDIIIPTWNSMPELEECLKSIKVAFPEGVVDKVIVVDKSSDDDTLEVAKKYGCYYLVDNDSLGSARLTGLHHSDKKWIVFIDSDIRLPEDWFIDICSSLYTYFNIHPEIVGWFYGRPVDDFEPMRSEKLYKMKIELGNRFRILKKGERPYTHNSICLREPLLNADIKDLNSWEDYKLGQTMMEAGYKIVEFPVVCIHMRTSTYNKWGDQTEAWSLSGEFKVKGCNIKTICKPFWFIYWGFRCAFHFKNISHLKYNLNVFWMQIKALFNIKKHFTWRR